MKTIFWVVFVACCLIWLTVRLRELFKAEPPKSGYYPSTNKEFTEEDMHEVGIQMNKSWLLDLNNGMTPRQITDQVISKIRKDSQKRN